MILDECTSTNDELRKQEAQGALEGAWVGAKKQTLGRGRHGRQWQSLEGNLHLSVLFRNLTPTELSWCPLALACAVCEALVLEFPELDIKIKWPNDLLIRGKKVGGFLCEGATQTGLGSINWVIAGLGLNLLTAPSDKTVQMPATSLFTHVGKTPQWQNFFDQSFDRMVKALCQGIKQLRTQGPDWVKTQYEQFAYFKFLSEISWNHKQNQGIVQGLGEFGELIVQSKQGKIIKLLNEEISGAALQASDESLL